MVYENGSLSLLPLKIYDPLLEGGSVARSTCLNVATTTSESAKKLKPNPSTP